MPVSDHETAASQAPAGRVLVVDDLAANRNLLRRMLQRDGHYVIEAESGSARLSSRSTARRMSSCWMS